VVELASLIRHIQEENSLLSRRLRGSEQEAAFYSQQISQNAMDEPQSEDMRHTLHNLIREDLEAQLERAQFQLQAASLAETLYCAQSTGLLEEYCAAGTQLQEAQIANQQHSAELAAVSASRDILTGEVEKIQTQCNVSQELLQAANELADNLKVSANTMKEQMKELEAKLAQGGQTLQKEQDAVQRLTLTVQKARMAEEGLRAEIEQ
jgi:chromosome segregation ATPase